MKHQHNWIFAILTTVLINFCYSFRLEDFQQGPRIFNSSVSPSLYIQQDITSSNPWQLQWFGDSTFFFHSNDTFGLYTTSTSHLFVQDIQPQSSQWTFTIESNELYMGVSSSSSSFGDVIVCHLTNSFNRQGECHTIKNVSTVWKYFPTSKTIVFYPATGNEFIVHQLKQAKSIRVPLPKILTFQASDFIEFPLPGTGVYFIRANESIMVGYDPTTQRAFVHEESFAFTRFVTLPTAVDAGIVQILEDGNNVSRCAFYFPKSGWETVDDCIHSINLNLVSLDFYLPIITVGRATRQDVCVFDTTKTALQMVPLPIPVDEPIENNNYQINVDNGRMLLWNLNVRTNHTTIYHYDIMNQTGQQDWTVQFNRSGFWSPVKNTMTGRIFLFDFTIPSNTIMPLYVIDNRGNVIANTTCLSKMFVIDTVNTIFYDTLSNGSVVYHAWGEGNRKLIDFSTPFALHNTDSFYYALNFQGSSVSILRVQRLTTGFADVITASNPFQFYNMANLTWIDSATVNYFVLYHQIELNWYLVHIKDASMVQLNGTLLPKFQFEIPTFDLALFSSNDDSEYYLVDSKTGDIIKTFTFDVGTIASVTFNSEWLLFEYVQSLGICSLNHYNMNSGLLIARSGFPCGSSIYLKVNRYFTQITDSMAYYYDLVAKKEYDINNWSSASGSTISSKSPSGQSVVFSLDSYAVALFQFCENDFQCDDGQRCTLDVCNGTICQHSMIPNCDAVCPSETPYKCSQSGNCVSKVVECYNTSSPNCNWICADGSCVSGKEKCKEYSPQYGCAATQILCPDGSCATNLTNCLCDDRKSVRCYDQTCVASAELCPTPPFLDPVIPVEVVIDDGKETVITIPGGDLNPVGEITIPPKSGPKDSSVIVNPVPIDTIRDVTLPDKTVIVSPVVDVSLKTPNGTAVTQFDPPVKLSLAIGGTPATGNPCSSTLSGALCLAFINTTTNSWQCVDSQLQKNTSNPQVVEGSTPHFTSFAVLFDGSKTDDTASTDPCNAETKTQDKDSSSMKWIILGCVLGAVVVVAALIAVGAVMFHKRKAARIATMRARSLNNANSAL